MTYCDAWKKTFLTYYTSAVQIVSNSATMRITKHLRDLRSPFIHHRLKMTMSKKRPP